MQIDSRARMIFVVRLFPYHQNQRLCSFFGVISLVLLTRLGATTHKDDPPSQTVATFIPSITPPAEIEQAVQAWAEAWSSKDVEKYLSFYSDGFVPEKKINQTVWKNQRHKALNAASSIRVTLTDIRVTVSDADHAQVTFLQAYQSDTYQDKTRKTLSLKREGGIWKIVREVS